MVLPSRAAGRRLVLCLTTAGFVLAPVAVAPVFAAPPSTPFIAELNYDPTGSDSNEFVEVQLPPGTTSAGLQLVLYNGSNGAVYDTDPVPEVTAGTEAAVAVVDYPANGLQNGSPDGIALVDATGTVLEFLSYEGTMTAVGGPADGRTSTDIAVRQDNAGGPTDSLSRRYDPASDTVQWQPLGAATKGQVNPALIEEPPPPPVELCDAEPTHEIGTVQGTGPATTVTGEVTLRGVVVGDVPGLSGFYLQDPDGDGDPGTSDALFVFGSGSSVDLGDTVAVRGVPAEFGGQTQVAAGDGVDVCADGTAADLPAATPLDLPAADEARERLEGMRVAPADTLTVSEVFDLTSFGELTLSAGGLLVQPTELARPGVETNKALLEENRLRSVVLDDAVSARVSVTTRPYLSATTPVRVGDELAFAEPLVLGYGFDAWRLQPADGTAEGVFTAQNTRPAAPAAVGGDVQIGAFNVLNYFVTLTGDEARGARTPEAFEKQAAKIVTAIEALGADVVTLMEIEDTDSTGHTPGNADQALADLVRRLNVAAGGTKWAYVPMPDELYAVDRDVIRSAIIYQPAAVTPVGESVGLVDEDVWFNAREPIAQTFQAQGDTFTVVANHFKSKSPGSPTGDNVDKLDGQGEWNGDRVRQAQSLAAFTQALRAATKDDDVLLLGDFNAYSQEDPIETLRTAGFVDLGAKYDAGRYSYVFNDMSGSLDHALATQALDAKVTDVTHWNINAVESFAYQYTGDPALFAANPYRSSDHDPVLVGVDLDTPAPPPPPVKPRCNGVVATIVGTERVDVIRGTRGRDVILARGGDDVILSAGGNDLVCAGSGNDLVDGGDGNDVLFGESGNDELYGRAGNDTIFGGPGRDVLQQGPGRGHVVQDGRAPR